jgi:hypothetical protein
MRYYLLVIYGDIEPSLKGPYRTEQMRDCAAVKQKKKSRNEDGIFALNVTTDGRASVSAYSGGFMDGMWGNPCSKSYKKPTFVRPAGLSSG